MCLLSTHIALGLDGIEFIVNGSASYFELRKANVAVDLVLAATRKSGGCYLYSNLRGCDGQRIMFNGGSCIALNGNTVSRTRQFSLEEMVTFSIDTFSRLGLLSVLLAGSSRRNYRP